jgi:hypothetical protein
MNIYIISYPGGACGTFITYFINRHKSFANPWTVGEYVTINRKSIPHGSYHFQGMHGIYDYEYQLRFANIPGRPDNKYCRMDNIERAHYNKMLQVGKFRREGSFSKQPDHQWMQYRAYDNSVGETITDWIYGHNIASNKKFGFNDYRNQTPESIAMLPEPVHLPGYFLQNPNYLVADAHNNTYKHITITVPLAQSTRKFTRCQIPKKHILPSLELHHHLPIPNVCLDIYNLLNLDDLEYNKLLDFIEQPPLDNWKELITDYRTAINY